MVLQYYCSTLSIYAYALLLQAAASYFQYLLALSVKIEFHNLAVLHIYAF